MFRARVGGANAGLGTDMMTCLQEDTAAPVVAVVVVVRTVAAMAAGVEQVLVVAR